MRLALAGVFLAIAIFFALISQEFISPIYSFFDARVLLVPMLFCYGALILPTWGMLLLAAFTGFISDLMYLQVVGDRVEIALGWSIVYFVFFGTLSHGFQPAFLRGHWWIHLLLAGLGTSAYLALQYVMISFRRQGFLFNEIVFWRIVGPGLMAAFAAVIFHFFVLLVGVFIPPDRQSFLSRR